MSSNSKTYTNGEVSVTWEPEKCIHSGNCARGLFKVFNPKRKPWIDMDQATSEEIVNQVKKCPSGALGYFYNEK
ncbi:putative Fe-S cluster protein YjdI [Algoriphagus boseongensis]|uniref:Putative Fe-S cluster protein YjdI n=1 Tax=Algoriphagus boseongensis TaxID=1442587 RepID=A0A4R6T8T4_9BACT|nr:(4Fe-4S)-binding protein [Algoriphagus boseongensis]TDQ19136.1 putative Fe-S cluster protein YjdI [Algoriphagus boseongensis]